MRLLLDTHSFLWFHTNDPQLSETALTLIAEPGNEIFISWASFWELAIKVSLGKYPMAISFEQFFVEAIDLNQFLVLPLEIRHAAVLSSLPMHHRDPFDRMIVSQALVEQLPIVSVDKALDLYGITRLWK